MKSFGAFLFTVSLLFPLTVYAQGGNLPFDLDKIKQKIIYLQDSPRLFSAEETITFKPEEPLPFYGRDTRLCFGVGEKFNPQENPEYFKSNQEKIFDITGDLRGANFTKRKDVIEFVSTDVKGGKGALLPNTGSGIPMPTVIDWKKGIVQMGACFPVNPESDAPIASIDIKFLKSFSSDTVFWTTSNQAELMFEAMDQQNFDENEEANIVIDDTEKIYKANENVEFSPETPLPVYGSDTSLCFVVGQEKNPDHYTIKETYLGKKDNLKTSYIEGYGESIDGEKYHFSKVFSSAWEMEGFSGNVMVCTSLKGASTTSEPIVKISLTPKIDIKSFSVKWRTSNFMDRMKELAKKEKEEAKTRSFIPVPLYEALVSVFPSDGKGGRDVLGSQSIKIASGRDIRDLGEGRIIVHQYPVYGLFLSLSDDHFFITPKEKEQMEKYSIRISSKDIHSCSAIFFGDRNDEVFFVIDDPAFTIEMGYEDKVIEWCWKNKIPIMSRNDYYEWDHGHGVLPTKPDESQFSSLGAYKAHLKKSCGCN